MCKLWEKYDPCRVAAVKQGHLAAAPLEEALSDEMLQPISNQEVSRKD